MEAIAAIITDACLADCIEALGDHADNPSTDELREVLPGVVERHGVAVTRIMLAATVVGEAPAARSSATCSSPTSSSRCPKAEPTEIAPRVDHPAVRRGAGAMRAKRAEARRAKKEADRARREQSAQARRRK